MTYTDALNYIHSMPAFTGTIDFEKTKVLMEYLGQPQDRLKVIHIAGTNGKGSTAAFINSILIKAGYRVGLYTSPYIERFTERIKTVNCEISQNELADITATVRAAVEKIKADGRPVPTEFDVITAIAFIWFDQKKTDIVVLETGMGGRLDSTNVVASPELEIITSISYDHMAVLGNTLPEIAYEKAGIIKPGTDVLLYPQNKDVYSVFEEKCASENARLHDCIIGRPGPQGASPDGQFMDIDLSDAEDPALKTNFKQSALQIPLLGTHQLKNASMAINAAAILRNKGWNISNEAIVEGVRQTRWNGRFEILRRAPFFLIDGGHNTEGIESLVTSIRTIFPGQKIIFIFGVLADKAYQKMIEIILPLSQRIFTITVPNPRALPAAELAEAIRSAPDYSGQPVIPCSDISAAVNASLDLASSEDVICAFGSLYYIGIVRGLLVSKSHEKLEL